MVHRSVSEAADFPLERLRKEQLKAPTTFAEPLDPQLQSVLLSQLPGEIRLMVWRFFFMNHKIYLYPHQERLKVWFERSDFGTRHPCTRARKCKCLNLHF